MADLRVLLDANILLDVLANREPYYLDSAGVWASIEIGQAQGLVAAHSVTTLWYLLKRYTNQKKTTSAISSILKVFSVAAIDEVVLQQALALNWSDYEDAVQACAASNSGAHYLVTRNAGDYPRSPVPVISPGEFLVLISNLPD